MTTNSRVRTERTPLSLSDFEKEITRLTAEAESTNILIYGDSNCGKTTTAGTAPGNNFWIMLEPGVKVAARNGAKGDAVKVSDSATAWACVDWLKARHRYRKYSWVVLDGATTIQNAIRLGYTQEAFDLKGNRAHRNLPDKPDYFNTQNFLKTWIGALVDMPVNLLVTAHASRLTDYDDGENVVFPGFQGKGMEVSNAITGLMDVTGYMERCMVKRRDSNVEREVHRLWFSSPRRKSKDDSPTRYICGDKFNALGRYMDNPTLPKMLDMINGKER